MYYRAALAILLFVSGALAAVEDSIPNSGKAPFSGLLRKPEYELLEKARAANNDLYSNLKSFVCEEEIQRYKGDLKGSKTHLIDHVSAKLSFENGEEHYNNVRQNTRMRPSLSDLPGAWSTGEFGTLLQQTERLLETQSVTFVAFTALAGQPSAIYSFIVPESGSPWDLEVGLQHYRIPFVTQVWISTQSGEILKIQRKSISIPYETRISEIDWDVTLDTVSLNGQTWLLPTQAGYSVSYAESKRREWNEMSFSGYRRYGSESVLRFDASEK
jgi:hypothetical protein